MGPGDFSRPLVGCPASSLPIPVSGSDPRMPLLNLSVLSEKMDSLRRFLSESIESGSRLTESQVGLVSAEIESTIQHIILNGAALVATEALPEKAAELVLPSGSGDPGMFVDSRAWVPENKKVAEGADLSYSFGFVDTLEVKASEFMAIAAKKGPEVTEALPPPPRAAVVREANCKETNDGFDVNSDIIELDAVELLAEHIHFCEICGKGFKRDANLRMHMRAHGNQFKTLEALAKPDKCAKPVIKARFSCPFPGCNRNRAHKKFRPLKSAICVKNHFKRSHCPKMYSCNRCNKKSFSVVADLKSHLKHCGECRWKCSCGTSFSRKDKLFGHLALFEGHMPAVMDDWNSKEAAMEEGLTVGEEDPVDNELFAGLLDGFDSFDYGSLEDVLCFPSNNLAGDIVKI